MRAYTLTQANTKRQMVRAYTLTQANTKGNNGAHLLGRYDRSGSA